VPSSDDDVVTGGLTRLRLTPAVVVAATGRQLGFWGGDAAAGDRAARVLTRVQGMLGYDDVLTAVPVGGRTPTERVRWVPWGEPRVREREPRTEGAPWPGAVPGPAPARVFDPPLAAELLDADGRPVAVSGRGEQSAPPAVLRCDALAGGGGPVRSWAGPWLADVRWWERRRGGPATRLRAARWQVVVAGEHGAGVACLVSLACGQSAVEAVYD
jgi:protein ImuB